MAFSVLLVASCAGNVILYREKTTLEEKNATLHSRIDRLMEQNKEWETFNARLESDLEDAERENGFYNKYVALVVDDGTGLYHNYDCVVLDDENFWCYGYSDSKYEQYKPCPRCHKEQENENKLASFTAEYYNAKEQRQSQESFLADYRRALAELQGDSSGS